MLRRKLMLILGSLVGLLVIVSVTAVWLLQGVLNDLDHTGKIDAGVVEEISSASTTITQIEIELRELQLRRERHLDTLIDLLESLKRQCSNFGVEYGRPIPQAQTLFSHLMVVLPRFEQHVGALATTEDSELAMAHTQEALTASVELRRDILELSNMAHNHVTREQEEATARFRWLVLALGLVFLVLINVSIMVLVHVAGMILRPVDQLVAASRQWGQEHFEYRVAAAQEDEFGELGRAFNLLAAQLQVNEQRRLEMLQQVAITLNHELNNASSIIRLQLRLLERQGGGVVFEECLRQINESLARMTRTVEALKRVRRIVLTDYAAGMKMLDLERSVEDEPAELPPLPSDENR